MLFEFIKDITTYKKGNLPLEGYTPYLISRWLSFINPQICGAINESVNSLGNIDKDQHYKLLLKLYPKSKVPFIKYIKKVKEEKTEVHDKVSLLASNMEISERETKQLLELKEQLT
jgi:ribosomal protein S8